MERGKDIVLFPGESKVEQFMLLAPEGAVVAHICEGFKIKLHYGSDGLSIQSGFSNTENEEYLVKNCARLHPKHDFFTV